MSLEFLNGISNLWNRVTGDPPKEPIVELAHVFNALDVKPEALFRMRGKLFLLNERQKRMDASSWVDMSALAIERATLAEEVKSLVIEVRKMSVSGKTLSVEVHRKGKLTDPQFEYYQNLFTSLVETAGEIETFAQESRQAAERIINCFTENTAECVPKLEAEFKSMIKPVHSPRLGNPVFDRKFNPSKVG